jgi:RNA recognition motif-containing protein
MNVQLVFDPQTRESRGFGFVTMDSVRGADYCLKYLDGSILDGRVITVEKVVSRKTFITQFWIFFLLFYLHVCTANLVDIT